MQNQYTLSIAASDGHSNASGQTIIITLNDLNEQPSITIPTNYLFTIDENSPVGTTIGMPLNVTVSDPDNGQTLKFSMTEIEAASDEESLFSIDPLSGQIAFTSTAHTLDYESLVSRVSKEAARHVTVSIHDDGENEMEDNTQIMIEILDVNEMPTLDKQFQREVKENTGADQKIGNPIQGSDVDQNDTLSYELLSGHFDTQGRALLTIDATTGQVKTTSIPFDYEAKSFYLVKVKVKDSKMMAAFGNIVLTVIDINEPATIMSPSLSVSALSSGGALVGNPIVAIDPDTEQRLQYSLLSSPNASNFEIWLVIFRLN